MEKAVKDYLLLAQLPQFEEIRQALTYIENLPQIAAPILIPEHGEDTCYYEIPRDIYFTATKNNRRVNAIFPDMSGSRQTDLFYRGFLHTDGAFFINEFVPQSAKEMLYSFSLCRDKCATAERGDNT